MNELLQQKEHWFQRAQELGDFLEYLFYHSEIAKGDYQSAFKEFEKWKEKQ